MKPTIERLRLCLRYDPESGVITNLIDRGGHVRAGMPVTRVNSQGYLVVGIDGRALQAHRVAYALHHGRWPDSDIDHRNGLRDDNRISNLRETRHNNRNRGMQINNTSGEPGIHFERGKWKARVSRSFDSLDEARAWVQAHYDREGYAVEHNQRKSHVTSVITARERSAASPNASLAGALQ